MPALDVEAESDPCHAKGCTQPATATCERCGRRFCSTHSGELVLQRRDERSERPARQDTLARLPTHTETYTLCAPCRGKPVSRNMQLPELQSLLGEKRRQGS